MPHKKKTEFEIRSIEAPEDCTENIAARKMCADILSQASLCESMDMVMDELHKVSANCSALAACVDGLHQKIHNTTTKLEEEELVEKWN